jgi:hypothetical protein
LPFSLRFDRFKFPFLKPPRPRLKKSILSESIHRDQPNTRRPIRCPFENLRKTSISDYPQHCSLRWHKPCKPNRRMLVWNSLRSGWGGVVHTLPQPFAEPPSQRRAVGRVGAPPVSHAILKKKPCHSPAILAEIAASLRRTQRLQGRCNAAFRGVVADGMHPAATAVEPN